MKAFKKPIVIEVEQLNARGMMGSDWFWDAVTDSKTSRVSVFDEETLHRFYDVKKSSQPVENKD